MAETIIPVGGGSAFAAPGFISPSSDPTVNNDGVDTAGVNHAFQIGEQWLNQSTGQLWYVSDVTTGAAVWHIVPLPSQSTHTGKFLQTDGTSASWQVPTAGEASFSQVGMNGLLATSGVDTVQEAFQEVDNTLFKVGDPTGLVIDSYKNPSTTTISFNNGTREFTIAPKAPNTTFDVFIAGKRYTETGAQVVTIDDTDGNWFIYFDGSGALVASQTPWSINSTTAQVAIVNWDATNNVAISFMDERHGVNMPYQVHNYNHFAFGTRYISGLQAGGFTLGSDNNITLSLSNGVVKDEDIEISITHSAAPGTNQFEQVLSPIAQIPIYWRSGASGVWRKVTPTTNYVFTPGANGRAIYNQFTGGNWQQTQATNGYHVAVWLFATSNVSEPVIAVMGQREDNTLANAQTNNSYSNLNFGTMPFAEYKVLYRIICKTSTAATAFPDKTSLQEVLDFRSVSNAPSGTFVATSHSNLTDLGFSASQHTGFVGASGSWTPTPNEVPFVVDATNPTMPVLSSSSDFTFDSATSQLALTAASDTDVPLLVTSATAHQSDSLISAVGTSGSLVYTTVDGPTDTEERGIAWKDAGNHKWENYIWKDEGGEFLYTYQNEVDVDILCLSRGGRLGINKATNEVEEHAYFTGTGLDDATPGGLFTGGQQLWYQIVIDGTGTPDTYKWRTSNDGISWGSYTTGVSITGLEQTLNYGVTVTFAATTGHTLNDQWDFVAFTQTPAGMLTVAPPRWKECYFFDGTYHSTTYAMSSFQVGNTTLFSGATDFHYFGYITTFRSINLNFSTFGTGVTLKVEYYNGAGWTEITSGSHRLVDGTANCTKNGTIQWDRYLITDWAETAVSGETMYWVRVSSTTGSVIAPVVQTSSPSPVAKLAVYAGNLDSEPQFYVDGIGRIYGYTAKLAAQSAPPPHEEGTLYFDSRDPYKSMTLMTSATNVNHQLGQEHLIRVYNNSGSQINDREVVYLNGAYTDGTPTIAKAQSDVASTSRCFGLATHNIPDANYGFVCGLGIVHDVDTSAWNVGDRLYVSSTTAGGLVTTQPSTVVPVGVVIKKDATTGSIYVQPGYATGLGTITLTTGFLNSSGANGTVGYVWDSTNKYVAIRAGATANNTWFLGTSVASIILPSDFLSFPTNAFHGSTQKNSEVVGNYMYVGVYKNAVADTNINLTSGASIWPTNTNVWEDKTLTFGSTYSPGDNLLIQVDTYVYDNAPQQYGYLRGVYILYNKLL